MTITRKLVFAVLLALLTLPAAEALADDRRNDCDIEEHDDDCRREKPGFQTKFFSE